ncbi:MAG: stage II sporulation protein P [Bacilli bacterium]|nr:stage II sporulation protein P [Bacilli bacterium]MDD4406668.1 stage II sporulation protein P [Bacilli bacterium]
MKKRFIARKKPNFKILKIIICLFIIYLTCFLTVKFLFKSQIKISDEKRVNEYLAIASNNLIGEISIIDLLNMNLISPDTFLKLSFSSFKKLKYKDQNKAIKASKEIKDPIIYIYNTHQSENYDPGTLSIYNITPTVYMASIMLQKALEKKDIYSVVEEADIKSILNINNLTYSDSYQASRLLLNEAIKKYPSVKYFIDIHRDSVTDRYVEDDKSYAKLMFVIGMNHENYLQNEKLMIRLYDYIKENKSGIIKNNYYGKNSIYNQNFNVNTILIEVGGVKNTIDEVYNSVSILADAIEFIVGDDNG